MTKRKFAVKYAHETRKVSCVPTLEALNAAVEEEWPVLQLRDYLLYQGDVVVSESPVPEGSKFMVKHTGQSFFKYKATGPALTTLAKDMLGVDIYGSIGPMQDDRPFEELNFDMDKACFKGGQSAKQLVSQTAQAMLICLEATTDVYSRPEVSQRAFIVPVLSLAVLLARASLQDTVGRDKDWGMPVLVPDHLLCGSAAWGLVDFDVFYRFFMAMLVVEVKEEKFLGSWAQLIMQIHAVRQRMLASLGHGLKKNNVFQAQELEQVDTFAVMCNAGQYELVLFSPAKQGKPPRLVVSAPMLLPLTKNTCVDQLEAFLGRAVRKIACVMKQAVEVVDSAKLTHPKLTTQLGVSIPVEVLLGDNDGGDSDGGEDDSDEEL